MFHSRIWTNLIHNRNTFLHFDFIFTQFLPLNQPGMVETVKKLLDLFHLCSWTNIIPNRNTFLHFDMISSAKSAVFDRPNVYMCKFSSIYAFEPNNTALETHLYIFTQFLLSNQPDMVETVYKFARFVPFIHLNKYNP